MGSSIPTNSTSSLPLNYVHVVWVGYDIALTTSQEIDAMWRRRLTSIPSFMYFVTRYFGFIFLVYNAFSTPSAMPTRCGILSADHHILMIAIISNRNTLLSCYVWGMLQAIGVQLLSLLVNGLLAFRVYAFYHGNTRMKRLILTLWILESTIEVAVTIWAKVMTGEPVPPPENMSISGCISDTAETPFLTILGWLVNIVYSVICFCLIAYRFLTVYFEECMTSGIAERFLYDGALLFILLCGMCCYGVVYHQRCLEQFLGSNVVNIVLLYAVPKSPIILIGFSWFIGAGSVASSRTILSLRGGLHESKRSITEYRLSATVEDSRKLHTLVQSTPG
ncbi:hypothetical protein BC629DRAFT_302385 [Irpex lacteus]|nr:hypothetical protein BC629DRAFT_302385 [Irpex lacteus]